MIDWLINNAIALLALGVAMWSAWYTKKYSGKQTFMQEESLNIEKKRERERVVESKKARFEVKFIEQDKNGRLQKTQLRLINRGKGDAKNVSWTINGESPSKYPDVLDRDEDIDHFDRIRSGTVTPKIPKIATSKDSERTWIVNVKWDDDAEKNNTEEFELRL